MACYWRRHAKKPAEQQSVFLHGQEEIGIRGLTGNGVPISTATFAIEMWHLSIQIAIDFPARAGGDRDLGTSMEIEVVMSMPWQRLPLGFGSFANLSTCSVRP